MKTIGLLAGMSWESSLEYYRVINEETKRYLGGAHSAKCLMYSFDFQEIAALQDKHEWGRLADILSQKALALKNAGADFIIICSNTMHAVAGDIQVRTGLKVLHIADATGEKVKKQNLKKVGLLGTNFTMESDFYRQILRDKFSVDIITPGPKDRKTIHEVIYYELVLGVISEASKRKYLSVIDRLRVQGAEGIILGCTEIPLLIKQEDVPIPVFDTTIIHSKAAVDYALQG